MFENQHPVSPGQSNGPARSAFAGNRRDHRHVQGQAAFGRAGNGLGLSALFGTNARIGSGGIDKGDDRQVKALGHIHQTHGLAIALGPGHAEIVLQPRGCVVTLFMAHNQHGHASEPAETADYGLIIGKTAVTAQLDKLFDQPVDIVDEVRPLRMAGDLGLLPRVKMGIGLVAQFIRTGAKGT